MPLTELDRRAVNTIRLLAVDAVEKANSGHPGMPMGMALPAYVLWTRFMQHSPANPEWRNRDRFVLSAGHGSMLLYSLLHLSGYDLPLTELENFRQWGSATPGHPERGDTPGVETTTGPLGQGFGNGVGMALAVAFLAHRYNRPEFPLFEHYIYGVVSDGDLMEGVASEAASLAGHLALGRVIYLYDDNDITIDGGRDLSMSEGWQERFSSYGWHVQAVEGMDADGIEAAIANAQADCRPSIIGCKTVIGHGSPNKSGSSASHGSPLGAEEAALTRSELGWADQPLFHVPTDVKTHMSQAVTKGRQAENSYQQLLDGYAEAYPEEAAELQRVMTGELPTDWAAILPAFEAGSSDATRNASGKVINALASHLPTLFGGSADLAGSTKTDVDGSADFSADDPAGRNLRFGVREHGMASLLNGMALYGGIIPYGGTFLVFSDYMRASMRLAALMGLRVIYVLTHDSIGLGEDGPTHQPIEHLAALRAIPNMTVIRPADGVETGEAWKSALTNASGPTVLALTRQNVPNWAHEKAYQDGNTGARQGAYILQEPAGKCDVVLVSSGSEVGITIEAAGVLAESGIRARVVSMPSWELFAQQSASCQEDVLGRDLPRVAIEAASPMGWERWVGNDPKKGLILGLDRFGASAPYETLYAKFGLSADSIASRVQDFLA